MNELDQEIARLQDQLSKVKEKKAVKENGYTFVTGAMIMNMARKDPEIAKLLVESYDTELNRYQDKARVLDFENELRELLDMPKKVLAKPARNKKEKSENNDISVAQDSQTQNNTTTQD